MKLFENYGFYRSFAYYLMGEIEKIDFFSENEEEKVFFKKLNSIMDSNDKESIEKINEIVNHIGESKCANKNHYEAYLHLKKISDLTDEDIYNLYAVMFEIFEYQNISFPACEVLYENFHLIVCDIIKENNCSVRFDNENDIRNFENEVYKILGIYVIENVKEKDLSIWGEEYNCKSPTVKILKESKPFEEYEDLNCYVHIADQETVDRVKNVEYLPGYNTSDIDKSIFFIENMITVTNKGLTDAVTFQIIGYEYFNSYQEMFEKLGTEPFGYTEETSEICAQRTEELFSKYDPEGAMALRVRKLRRRILKKIDYMFLQDYEKLLKEEKNKSSKKRNYLFEVSSQQPSYRRHHEIMKRRREVESKEADKIIKKIIESENTLFDLRKKLNISLNLRVKNELEKKGAYIIPLEMIYNDYILCSLEYKDIKSIAKQLSKKLPAKIIIIDGDLKRDFVYSNEEKDIEEIIRSLSEKHTVIWL